MMSSVRGVSAGGDGDSLLVVAAVLVLVIVVVVVVDEIRNEAAKMVAWWLCDKTALVVW